MVKINQTIDLKPQFELLEKFEKSSMLPKLDEAHKSSGESNTI